MGKEVWRWTVKCSSRDAADNSLSLSLKCTSYAESIKWQLPDVGSVLSLHHAPQLNRAHECYVVFTNFCKTRISFCVSAADRRLLRWNGGQWQKATMFVMVLTPHPPTIKHWQQLSQNLSLTRKFPFARAYCGTCQGDTACVVAEEAAVGISSDCPYQRHRHFSFLPAFSLLFYLLTIPTACLVSWCSSVFLPRNVNQQKHFMHWSRFSGRDKTLLQPGTLFTA